MSDADDWPETVTIGPMVMGFAIERELSGPPRAYVRGDLHEAEVTRLRDELASGSFYKESDIDALMDRAKAADTARAEGVAQGLRMGLEHACSVIDAHSEYDQNMCCSGYECGCQGSSVHQAMKHCIASYAPDALIPAPAKPADGWTGPGENPHRYSPDPMLMGDCRICGHTREAHENVAFAPPAPREGGEG